MSGLRAQLSLGKYNLAHNIKIVTFSFNERVMSLLENYTASLSIAINIYE